MSTNPQNPQPDLPKHTDLKGWQPIAAMKWPKDGSDVLLYMPSKAIRVGFYSSKGEWQTSASFNKVNPLYWQKLPEGPA